MSSEKIDPQLITVNIHRPRVDHVDFHDDGKMAISLSNGTYAGTVTMFITDSDWDALVSAVASARAEKIVTDRLEYLRGEIRAERISTGEIVELQGLSDHIDPGDVELLEWAGVPEE